MVDERTRGGIEFAMSFDRGPARRRPAEDAPFAILVVGDFGGRGESLAGRRPMKVDLDSFDALFERLEPEVRIALPGAPDLVVPIRALDDFHPDALYDALDLFADVRRLRRELRDPANVGRIAAALGLTGARDAASPPAQPSAPTGEAALLERLLGRAPSEASPAVAATGAADDFIRKVVAPHVVRGPDPREAELVEALERGATELMRALLHHPDFQALEATWRGLDFLVRNLALDENLELHVLDAGKDAIARDLADPAALGASELHRILAGERRGPSGAAPFAVVACAHVFAPTATDAALLSRLGAVASAAGAPLLATADHAAFLAGAGAAEDREAMDALRGRPEARAIGLLGPRFLLRAPYGPGMEETERFRFVEQPTPPAHDAFLWGPPAFLAACLLGRSFAELGWALTADQNLALGGLPVHTYRSEGEPVQTPCAERWLESAAVEALLARGIMPVQPVRGRDEVRLARFQSIADPPAPLLGY